MKNTFKAHANFNNLFLWGGVPSSAKSRGVMTIELKPSLSGKTCGSSNVVRTE